VDGLCAIMAGGIMHARGSMSYSTAGMRRSEVRIAVLGPRRDAGSTSMLIQRRSSLDTTSNLCTEGIVAVYNILPVSITSEAP
jgi:hypothetical protein